MRIEQGWHEIQCDPLSIVTVGSFDGVHRGHQAIVHFLEARTAEIGGHSTLVTFDRHPRSVLTGVPVPMLNTLEERIEHLAMLGLDRLVVLPFDEMLREMEAEEYVKRVLVQQIGVKEMVVGYDHHFGHERKGDLALLQAKGREWGFSTHLIPAQMVEDEVISSTQIRKSLAAGDIQTANKLLGYAYQLRGTVVQGAQRGRTIGFPTANIQVADPSKIIPKQGVYAIRIALENGERKEGMMNIGRRPTVERAGEVSIEAHIFDFEGDLYDQTLTLELVAFTREEQKFNSIEFLQNQLKMDMVSCKQLLKSLS
jgi:riboflavin kinase/FMN adenylyltransferase